MGKYFAEFDIADGELEKIMDDLMNAKEIIHACYSKLCALGVVVKREEETPPAATDGETSANPDYQP